MQMFAAAQRIDVLKTIVNSGKKSMETLFSYDICTVHSNVYRKQIISVVLSGRVAFFFTRVEPIKNEYRL